MFGYKDRDLGMDCAFEVTGSTIDEVLGLARSHCLEVHGLDLIKLGFVELTPAGLDKIRGAITEVKVMAA